MYLFDHGEPEEFLLFILTFNMTLAATGILGMEEKIQYLPRLVHGDALRKFEFLSSDVENIEPLNVDYYIKGRALYFYLWIRFQNKSTRCATKLKTAHSKSKTLCGALD